MTETGRALWERVAEPSHSLVHFKGPEQMGITLCGMREFPVWVSCQQDGDPTEQPVNCPECLEVARFFVARGLPRELRG